MERLALITIILPFVGAFIVGLNKKHFAQNCHSICCACYAGNLVSRKTMVCRWSSKRHL